MRRNDWRLIRPSCQIPHVTESQPSTPGQVRRWVIRRRAKLPAEWLIVGTTVWHYRRITIVVVIVII